MKTLEQMIAVMQAALEGKEIEVYDTLENLWVEAEHPVWDWLNDDYRIKPEEPKPEYVPYESAEEFLQAQREHGKLVVNDSNETSSPFVNCEGSVNINDMYRNICDFWFLFKYYHWKEDGTPCGKIKQ